MVRALVASPESPAVATPPLAKEPFVPDVAPRAAPARRTELQADWLVGARSFLALAPHLARTELALRVTPPRTPGLAIGAGVYGDYMRDAGGDGIVNTGGAGARLGVATHLYKGRLLRLWVGPAFEAGALLVAANARGPGDALHDVHTLACADLRLLAELALGRRARALVALDAGMPIRALHFAASGDDLFAYAGPYVGLALGVSLGPF